jgi:hypothetical protein
MRINLRCAYEDRHEVKALGAWWDANRKTWFIMDREDLTPFMRWIDDSYQPVPRKVRIVPGVMTGPRIFVPLCHCDVEPWEDCEHTANDDAESISVLRSFLA